VQLHQSLGDRKTEACAFGILSVHLGDLVELSKNLFLVGATPDQYQTQKLNAFPPFLDADTAPA
jgi:hypothetical protein